MWFGSCIAYYVQKIIIDWLKVVSNKTVFVSYPWGQMRFNLSIENHLEELNSSKSISRSLSIRSWMDSILSKRYSIVRLKLIWFPWIFIEYIFIRSHLLHVDVYLFFFASFAHNILCKNQTAHYHRLLFCQLWILSIQNELNRLLHYINQICIYFFPIFVNC